MGATLGIVKIPAHGICIMITKESDNLPVGKGRGSSRPAGKLPLALRGLTMGTVSHFSQDKYHRTIPRN